MPRKITQSIATQRNIDKNLRALEPYCGNHMPILYQCQRCPNTLKIAPKTVWKQKSCLCTQCNKHHLSEEKAIEKDNACGWHRLTPYITASVKHKYICPHCNTICEIEPGRIWDGHTQSCGCYGVKSRSETHWKGFEEISSTYLSSIKLGAKKRNILFNITVHDMWNQFIAQDKACALSGMPIFLAPRFQKSSAGTASLDRIDSSKGYTIDNIQWLHKDINRLKNNYQQDYFIQMCKLIAERN